jgi:hypothetical protein
VTLLSLLFLRNFYSARAPRQAEDKRQFPFQAVILFIINDFFQFVCTKSSGAQKQPTRSAIHLRVINYCQRAQRWHLLMTPADESSLTSHLSLRI